MEEVGKSCLGCEAHKYKCNHPGERDAKTMWVSRLLSDLNSDSEVEVKKGKKRKVELPA